MNNEICASSPIDLYLDKEFDELILKIGSLYSIIVNKQINQTKLLLEILKNDKFAECILKLTDVDDLQLLVLHIVKRYPLLCRSKIIKKELEKFNARKLKKNL